jgi:hypothetical protein
MKHGVGDTRMIILLNGEISRPAATVRELMRAGINNKPSEPLPSSRGSLLR